MKKMLTYLVLGCLVLGTGANAFAAEVNNNELRTPLAVRQEQGEERLEKLLDSLVGEGEFTEEKVDSILSFIEEKKEEIQTQRTEGQKGERPDKMQGQRPEGIKGQRPKDMNGKRHGIVEDMVEEGIISEEEADVIKEKNNELRSAEREERLNEQLDTLIEKGTITDDDKDEIVDFFEAKEEERKAEFEKIKDMSKEERKEYFEDKKEARKDPISEMVEAGIVTEEQAKEIMKSMPKHNGPKGDKRPPRGQKPARGLQNQEDSQL